MTNVDSRMDNDVQDEYTDYLDEKDKPTEADYAGGDLDTTFAHSDQSEYGGLLRDIQASIVKAIDAERKLIAGAESVVKVNTNESGQVKFGTFSVGINPVMIVKEKPDRGDTVITNYGPGVISIGLHIGIFASGLDTVAIPVGASRTIRTRNAMWAISSLANTNLDVQEEFN